ncbi:glycosyltransferase involved in cell wall biosynthesis [Alteromonadaceae bacterium 2753L.S.0a.02]|nr:glycosyltransferase involved in cell wall biosynthesis [Alteromonadaceae bacterium 2753L.S.0a.02]
MDKKKLVFAHLYNDYSGSPRILSDLIKVLRRNNCQIELYAGNRYGGVLDSTGCDFKIFWYRRSGIKLVRLLFYFFSQMHLFLKLICKGKNIHRIHVNTYLPFGASLAGKLLGIPVVYHIMETSLRPILLKRFLRAVMKVCATDIVYLSEDLYSKEKADGFRKLILYPTVSNQIYNASVNYRNCKQAIAPQDFIILMICSLRAYKGVEEFVKVASKLEGDTGVRFQLVLNASPEEVKVFKLQVRQPANLEIFSSQDDVTTFLKECSIMVNMSRPDQWVETFGLTILEAMFFGKPVIVPPVGAPTEYVENGIEGYQVSSYEIDAFVELIRKLMADKKLYTYLAENAYEKATAYCPSAFEANALKLFNETLGSVVS